MSVAAASCLFVFLFFFSSRRRHTRFKCDWSSDVCSSDLMIALIKAAKDAEEAKVGLMGRSWPAKIVTDMLARVENDATRPEGLDAIYGLGKNGYRPSATQAQAILDMRLQKLTGLEQEKIRAEYKEILERITDLLDILRSHDRLMRVIRDELVQIRDQNGDARRPETRAEG